MDPIYCSLISSVIEVITTHPLDVYKTKYQLNKNYKFNDFLNNSFKENYKGFASRFLGVVPIRSTFLFLQDFLNNKIKTKNNYLKDIYVICGSSLGQTLIDTPIELSKINKINKNDINILSYKGFLPHYARNLIFLASVYEAKKLSTNNYNIALYGAFGGLIGSYLSHPFDTLKTFKQSNLPIKLNYENAFRGANIRAGMGFINMLISLFIYETLKK